ncbi:MAG TPA: SPFH domain-containing protein [Pseudogracilibacillus sp.]|nr:SPFH domain-containing protein [Pseudogracilibacillus sp.]
MRTERVAWSANGIFTLGLIALVLYLTIINVFEMEYIFVVVFLCLLIILLAGLTIVKPNEAKVILLFGKYLGTIRHEGLIYTVPFTKRKRISLKIKSFENEIPIELSDRIITVQLILFYKVVDTAKLLFEVEAFEQFIQLQSETVLKTLWNENNEIEIEQITDAFAKIMQEKLERLGIEIVDLYIMT